MESTSFYLYGRGVIGTKTDTWGYVLQDGLGSTRQLATHEGVIAMSVAYTPWGDVLEYYGSGGIDFGYLGGMYDEDTGLIYLGNGQYYDPVTGRMLTRGAGQSNPYKPGVFDPAGLMIAPLGLIGLALGKKKKRGKWDTFIALLVVCVVMGMSVSACKPASPEGEITATITLTLPPPQVRTTHNAEPTPTPEPTTILITATVVAPPEALPTLPPTCADGVWWSGYVDDQDHLEKIAKRIYNEGASSFKEPEDRLEVFMSQAWALRTLQAFLYSEQTYDWITLNAFSVSNTKDTESWIDDNGYKEITRCILNTEPCAYGPNPWLAIAGRAAIQWISPQNLHRRDHNDNEIYIKSELIKGCDGSENIQQCQLPDMRLRTWIKEDIPDLVGFAESFVELGEIDTTGDGVPDFEECYWKGIYFFANSDSFQIAVNGEYKAPPEPYEQESLKCPPNVVGEGASNVILKLPKNPKLYRENND